MVTLDEDVAAKLKAEMRRSGKSLVETINEVLRRSLPPGDRPQPRVAFRIQARDLGALRPAASLDDVAGSIDRVEGDEHR
jgi:plasmid stability protein